MCVLEIWHLVFRVQLEKGLEGRSRTSRLREVFIVHCTERPLGVMHMGAEHTVPVRASLVIETCSLSQDLWPGCPNAASLVNSPPSLHAVWPVYNLSFHTPIPKGPER